MITILTTLIFLNDANCRNYLANRIRSRKVSREEFGISHWHIYIRPTTEHLA